VHKYIKVLFLIFGAITNRLHSRSHTQKKFWNRPSVTPRDLFLFFKNIFVANGLISQINTQAMYFKSITYTQKHCNVFPKNLTLLLWKTMAIRTSHAYVRNMWKIQILVLWMRNVTVKTIISFPWKSLNEKCNSKNYHPFSMEISSLLKCEMTFASLKHKSFYFSNLNVKGNK
jgi:hypothetical protein